MGNATASPCAYAAGVSLIDTIVLPVTSGAISADVAVAWLRALSSTWSDADVPEAKAEVLHAIYEQIV